MKKVLRKIKNYICYCGIEKEEFKAVKLDAYASNFQIWRILHIIMDAAFALLFVFAFFSDLAKDNLYFYLGAFLYSAIATVFFFVLNKKSILAQLIIYLSISVLFLFGCFITQNKPSTPAITFITFLLITPLFMIDKPYFMTLELVAASTVFLVWMYFVKDPRTWEFDLLNTIIFTIIAIMMHIIANSIRIKEFVLIRQINKQKDTDELTGLTNKAALTKAINDFFQKNPDGKGLLLVLDVDYFKLINDTYGHDVGDEALCALGHYLGSTYGRSAIVGRFGGDEFIVFFQGVDDGGFAEKTAKEMIDEAPGLVNLPTDEVQFGLSIGAAIYQGREKNYSELFKKADIALYKTKASRKIHYAMYQGDE